MLEVYKIYSSLNFISLFLALAFKKSALLLPVDLQLLLEREREQERCWALSSLSS